MSHKLLLPLFFASLLVAGSVLAVVSHTREQAVEQAGLATGRAGANQVVALRNFYTGEIASRAKKAGMELGFDFRQKPQPPLILDPYPTRHGSLPHGADVAPVPAS